MDVTNSNFIQILPEITETIRECDFIAIDTELSGLMRDRSRNRFDLPEERFAKDVKSSRGYFILQFGISCFTKCSGLQYTDRTYNFYIFPQKNKWDLVDKDRTFCLQSHAIQFLIENGFDFNKLFKDGVSYLTFQEKQKITEKLKSDKRSSNTNANHTPKDKSKPLSLEEQKKELMNAKGFLEVLEVIIFNKKPIVGHNLALDLIQMHNQFFDELTDDYEAFKQSSTTMFPLIYDTKFIAHSILEPGSLTDNGSRLYDLYCQLRDSDTLPKVKIDHLNEFFDDKQLPHQAGYDAYMSGYCFLVLCEANIRQQGIKKAEKGSIAKNSEIVENLANKIHLSYSHDFTYFNLSGPEEEPDRDHVFYMQFPQSWGTDDILKVFQHHGGVFYSRLDRCSALCALKDKNFRHSMLKRAKDLVKSNSNHKLYTYDTYLENFKPKRKSGGDDDDVDVSDA